jgi:hypothetical protein
MGSHYTRSGWRPELGGYFFLASLAFWRRKKSRGEPGFFLQKQQLA